MGQYGSVGCGTGQFVHITSISNPLGVRSGDLFITENWSDSTGGNWYLIDVDAAFQPPYLIDPPYIWFPYSAADYHYLTIDVSRRPVGGSSWVHVQTVPSAGLLTSGTDLAASWHVLEPGFTYEYKFVLTAESSYEPVAGDPVSYTSTSQVIMGNQAPSVSPGGINISDLNNGCLVWNRSFPFPHMASVSASDGDTPGGLTYRWYRTPGEGIDLLFWDADPNHQGWWASVEGPLSSVPVMVSMVAKNPEEEAKVTINVSVSDAGGGVTTVSERYGICTGQGDCNCGGGCECPCLGDPQCDRVASVQDVAKEVDVAFRGAAAVFDPQCPEERTDVNCDGNSTVQDVVKVVNVAFRGASPTTEFCDPCAP